MRKAPGQVSELIRGAVEGLGYELVGVEALSHGGRGQLLRVYIDQEAGITLTDCERVSHQVSGVLDVESPLRGDYVLEVSSPGLDRPLFERAHFERFVGEVARIKLTAGRGGRSNFKGAIVGVEGDQLLMDVDGETVRMALADIASARLVPQY